MIYLGGWCCQLGLLVKLLQQESFDRVMVFGNRRDLVRKLDDLLRTGWVADSGARQSPARPW